DVHMNIERFVAGRAGEEAAGLMHTARSRNDQALTDVRLYARQAILGVAESTADLARALVDRARSDARLPLPGLSHTQPAAVTSLGHWWAAHAHALERDLDALRALEPFADQSPLGAAAGFGTTWPIDRARAAELLGFSSLQTNSLDCVASRGELEARFAAALASLMNHLSSLAQDLIVLSSPPRRYVTLSDAYVTGSSIMPQKRNPDFCEVTRAKAAYAHGMLQALLGIGRAALMGYNRDHQWTKYMILDLVEETRHAPAVFAGAIRSLTVDAEAMARDARAEFMNAVEIADLLAQTRGLAFRRAHALVAEACRETKTPGALERDAINALLRREKVKPPFHENEWKSVTDPLRILERRQSAGSPNPKRLLAELKPLEKRLASEARRLAARRARLDSARRAALRS
ncbi:MAG: argininosuccinate lyase, partial [Candidatus Sumerlaeota bacterium]|nr:argininosuccinate lyase [Candidatus Sumerlaeota bacterium]